MTDEQKALFENYTDCVAPSQLARYSGMVQAEWQNDVGSQGRTKE